MSPHKNPDEAARLLRPIENAEIERRLFAMENAIGKLEGSLLERHAKLITIIFSFMSAFVAVCAILVTVLGFLSKSETREATKEMKSEVKEAVGEMEK